MRSFYALLAKKHNVYVKATAIPDQSQSRAGRTLAEGELTARCHCAWTDLGHRLQVWLARKGK
jgi:hypothetical protein